MFKKILYFMAVVGMCFALTACGNKSEETNSEDIIDEGQSGEYFLWEKDKIVGYTELGLKQEELIIPENCVSVKELRNNSVVKKVSFENPDTQVLGLTFENCVNLETVILPDNLEVVETSLFDGCTKLKTITIPSGVTTIKGHAFDGCTSLEEVLFGENIEKINLSAFDGCTSLKSVSLPDSLKEIGDDAFKGCTALNSIEFGTGIVSIGGEAFKDCDSLKSVVLPEGLLTLESYTFGYCDSLTEIYLPSTLNSIDMYSLVPSRTDSLIVYVKEGSYMDTEGWNKLIGASGDSDDTTLYQKQYY